MPSTTLLEIPPEEQVQMRAILRRARYGYLVAYTVRELQVFGLGVDGRALPGRCDPGVANLEATVLPVDVEVTGRAHGFCNSLGDRGETYHKTSLLFG